MDAVNFGIYLDYASTSPVLDEVLEATHILLPQFYANPDSLHSLGTRVDSLVQRSRKQIIQLLHCQDNEVIFTSGATEANNMAIKGIAFASMHKGKHLITSAIEHKSVLSAMKQLESVFGFELTVLSVDHDGIINLEELRSSLRKDTILVSIMAVNNEIGSIQPIQEITQIVKKKSNAYLHVDFVQALGRVPISLHRIDAASFSGHKLGGLKGSGVLFKGQNVPMIPLLSGGQQEFNLRSGTSNVIANITVAKVFRIALETQMQGFMRALRFKKYLVDECSSIPGFLCVSPESASPWIVAIAYPKIPSQIMLNALNRRNIYVSAISTCSTRSDEISYVHKAIGLDDPTARSVIRVSMSSSTTQEDIEAFVLAYKEVIQYDYST